MSVFAYGGVTTERSLYYDCCANRSVISNKGFTYDNSSFRHGFGAEVSLPLAQSVLTVSHDYIRFSIFKTTRLECHLQANAIRTLF